MKSFSASVFLLAHKSALRLALSIATVLTLGAHVSAQDESTGVSQLAENYPAWLSESVKADDFREPAESATLPTQPYVSNATTGTVYYQPAGALSGKTIFAMAGHGWTYDADRMIYYTQRGLSHGMVEDLGNADQMHIFAHLAFNAGATVVPFRPIDYQPHERILDNSMTQVEFYGNWRAGSSQQYYGPANSPMPYAISQASLRETASVRFRPYIPQTGYYPVYVWARDGADRIKQSYKIHHSGGIADIKVNWKTVGKTWVWLGTWHFNEGDSGFVETGNQAEDPYEAYSPHYAIADAVRFGNGMGDVPRAGGVSGFSREDEGDVYWIEQALGNNVDRRLFDAGADGNSTVSSPPKAAAYSNREAEGSFLDRLLISFHSNASSGKARGAVALYNASAGQRPTYQESLAEFIGKEINVQLRADANHTGQEWIARDRHTYNGINFGELRRDYLQNEMSATIVETAFHDNREDVSFLLDPVSRLKMAEATLRGILKWYGVLQRPNNAYSLPPSRPESLAAAHTKGGKIAVKLKAGQPGDNGNGAPIKVRVYRSTNGYGFDGGTEFAYSPDTTYQVDPLTTSGATFFRATFSNASGESLPSQTVAVGVFTADSKIVPPTALLVPLTTILDSTANSAYFLGKQPGGPYQDTAWTERVRTIYAIQEPAGAAEAIALASQGVSFDGAESAAIAEGHASPTAYRQLFIAGETQQSTKALISSRLIADVRNVLQKGGKVCVTGCGVAENLSKQDNRSKNFLANVLGVQQHTAGKPGLDLTSADDRFLPVTSSTRLAESACYWKPAQVVAPVLLTGKKGQSLPLLTYGGKDAAVTAIITRPFFSTGEIITLGFPLSLVKQEEQRSELMAAVIKQMNLKK